MFLAAEVKESGQGEGSPRGVLRDVPLVLMTCVVHYGVTRDWRQRGVYGKGCRPRQQKAVPPFGTVNAGAFLRNPVVLKTHTRICSQVKTPNRWLRLISASLSLIAIERNAELFLDLTDWQPSMNSQTDAQSSIPTPSFAPQEGLPSSHWDVT